MVVNVAQIMLQQLNTESSKVGLKMNLSKTKVMSNIDDERDTEIGDTVVESCVIIKVMLSDKMTNLWIQHNRKLLMS